jgi:hypothetical protein
MRASRQHLLRLLATVLVLVCAGATLPACGGDDDEQVVAKVVRTDDGRDEEPRDDAKPAVPSTIDDADAGGQVTPGRPKAQPRETRPAAGGLLPATARRAFADLAARHPGELGVAVMPVGSAGEPETVGELQDAVAWSTIKVPIAAAVLARGARGSDQADIEAALTASDNEAATRLWERLGGGTAAAAAVEAQLRLAGDDATSVQSARLRPEFSPFGQTSWSLADQARFMAGIDCIPSAPQLRSTMARVTSGQRWGLGSLAGAPEFKGGWGPGTQPGVGGGYLDRQMGIVTVDGRELAVAIAAAPSSGSHESGTAALDAIAGWLVEHVDTTAAGAGTRCRA